MGRRDTSAIRFQGVHAEDRIVCLSESSHRTDGRIIIEVISMALGTKIACAPVHDWQGCKRSHLSFFDTQRWHDLWTDRLTTRSTW
ncbi:hypothetical protein HYQ46_012073 [Verticillium longisporum]|nr:hypothetical protein HYQ46_012073 [Verticillium longisporum]